MAFTGRQLLKNVMSRMSGGKPAPRKRKANKIGNPDERAQNFAPRESSNFRGTQQNFMQPRSAKKSRANDNDADDKARKPKRASKKYAKKLPKKPAGTGPFDRSQRDSDDNLRTAKKGKKTVKKFAHKGHMHKSSKAMKAC